MTDIFPDAPRCLMMRKQSLGANLGSTLTVPCNVDSFPPPSRLSSSSSSPSPPPSSSLSSPSSPSSSSWSNHKCNDLQGHVSSHFVLPLNDQLWFQPSWSKSQNMLKLIRQICSDVLILNWWNDTKWYIVLMTFGRIYQTRVYAVYGRLSLVHVGPK